MTPSSTATQIAASFRIRLAGVDSASNITAPSPYTGDGTSGIYIWGAQLEAGAFPTSYIPTTTAAATRAADVAVMTGANFSSWYRQDEGTLFAEWTTFVPTGAQSTYPVCFTDNPASTSSVQLAIQARSLNNQIRIWQSTTGGGLDDFITPIIATSQGKAVATYGGGSNVSASANGGSVVTMSVPLQSSAFTNLVFGSAAGPTGYLNGHIRSIAYYPRRLSNAELQGITA